MWSLNTHEFVSKQLPYSAILRNNYKLDSIIVNKGQIHEELRNFLGVLQILIKLDNELRGKIQKFGRFTKRILRRI